ncbi:MAG: ribonuclease Z [Solobacterium sp.]|nr:ribonuclease Z [Solobacterium sp.]
MLEVTLLGCGGTMPLPGRWLTSLLVRYQGRGLLIDAGEGTQIAMKQAGLSSHNTDLILLTHYHGDHVMGLPGYLTSMTVSGRKEPVLIAGPKGLTEIVPKICAVASIGYELQGLEYTGETVSFAFPGHPEMQIHAFPVEHNIETWGYTIEVKRSGRFDAERARTLDIPTRYWHALQKGETVQDGEKTYTPELVLGPERKGIRLTYSTDTRPCANLVQHAAGSDLLICEGMYGEDEKISAAMENRHMTFAEAAGIAKEAGVKELWLTHYSPAEQKPEEHIVNARKIFANSQPGYDGKHTVLSFED